MADGVFGQAPARDNKTATLGLNQPQPAGVSYDGSNAGAQRQRSTESLIAELRVKRGANWFYWIAGLSLVNTVIAFSGGHTRFILGLGVTEVASEISHAGVIAVVINILVLGFFIMCGYFAGKLQKWAFLMGMGFYLLDGGIMALAQDWLGLAFHGYALFAIWKGFAQLKAASQSAGVAVLTGS